MMNTEKLIELCDEIEREADYIGRYTKTGAIYDDIQVILARMKDIRSAVEKQSDPHHGYWIPVECGVKCSSCGIEYTYSDYLHMMHQCPHCFAEMGEARKSPKTNGDLIRQMTDEELADMLTDKLTNKCAVCAYHNAECETTFCMCWEGVLKWLKQEVKAND